MYYAYSDHSYRPREKGVLNNLKVPSLDLSVSLFPTLTPAENIDLRL